MAFISELNYQDDGITPRLGITEFVEVTLSADEAARSGDFFVSFYHSDGTLAGEVSLAAFTPVPHPTSPGFFIYTIYANDLPTIGSDSVFITGPDDTSPGGQAEAFALTDTGAGGGVISFLEIAWGTSDITAVGGAADGATTTRITGSPSLTTIQFDIYGNRIDQAPTVGDSVVCFLSDTLIETVDGPKKVQDLRPSCNYRTGHDSIVTADGKVSPLRWVGKTTLTHDDLKNNKNLRPIRISAGSLGSGVPKQDLLVSRQHRILVSSIIAERMFGIRRVLVAAVKLLGLPGVLIDEGCESVDYFHILLDSHEVVSANGAPCESLYLGPNALDIMPRSHLDAIRNIFPDVLEDGEAFKSAAIIPENKKQRILVERHIKNKKITLDEDLFLVDAGLQNVI